MKTIAKLGLTCVVIIALLFSCKKADNSSYEESADMKVSADSTAVSSSAAVVDKNSKQKFIRTADIKFKVKNVIFTIRLKQKSVRIVRLKLLNIR
jgi:hypothetical protein